MAVFWDHSDCDWNRDIISGKLNDHGEMFQKHHINNSYLHSVFCLSPIYTRHNVSVVTDCNIFLWPTHNFGDAPWSCRGWFHSTPYPLANSVTTAVPMHPGGCSLTPEQAPQNKHLLKQQRAFVTLFFQRRYPLLQKDHGQNSRTSTQSLFSEMAKGTDCYFLWTQPVWQTQLGCRPAQEQWEQGCSRTRDERGAEGDPSSSCALPDTSHSIWTHGQGLVLVPGSIHSPGCCKGTSQVQSLISEVRLITFTSPLKCCNLN